MNRLLNFNPEPFDAEVELRVAPLALSNSGSGRACGCRHASARAATSSPLFEPEFEIGPFASPSARPHLPASPQAPRCPADTKYTVTGFGRYSDDRRDLSEEQFRKLLRIADEIGAPAVPPAKPVSRVIVVGHADLDAEREKREPGYLQFISEKRATAIYDFLCCRVARKFKTNDGLARLRAIRWLIVGRGARSLAAPRPQTEAERKCNRRVEIILERSDPLPPLVPWPLPRLKKQEALEAAAEHSVALEYYEIALQGTSGRYDRPEVAEQKAREIAEKVPAFLKNRKQEKELRGLSCPSDIGVTGCPDPADDLKLFKDALQGAASKFSDPDVVIRKAMEAAEAGGLGAPQMARKIYWKYASLPQPMDYDCEPSQRAPGGPPNHAVCRAHGHILEMSNRTVIAHDAEEYKKLSGRTPIRGNPIKAKILRKTSA